MHVAAPGTEPVLEKGPCCVGASHALVQPRSSESTSGDTSLMASFSDFVTVCSLPSPQPPPGESRKEGVRPALYTASASVLRPFLCSRRFLCNILTFLQPSLGVFRIAAYLGSGEARATAVCGWHCPGRVRWQMPLLCPGSETRRSQGHTMPPPRALPPGQSPACQEPASLHRRRCSDGGRVCSQEASVSS